MNHYRFTERDFKLLQTIEYIDASELEDTIVCPMCGHHPHESYCRFGSLMSAMRRFFPHENL